MKTAFLALAMLAALPLTAQANDAKAAQDYTFVEGGYTYLDPHASGVNADGAYLKGSYEFGRGFYGQAEASAVEFNNSNFGVRQYDVGVGYHRAFVQRFDGYGEVSYVGLRADGGLRANGYRVGAGVKVAFTDKLEGQLGANYRDGHDFSGTTSGVAALRYSFNDRWSVKAQGEFDGDANAYQVGVRYSF